MNMAFRSKPEQKPSRLPVGLLELNSCSCRWPVGAARGANQMFCGAVRKVPGSYCEIHTEQSTGRGTRSERDAGRILERHATDGASLVSSPTTSVAKPPRLGGA